MWASSAWGFCFLSLRWPNFASSFLLWQRRHKLNGMEMNRRLGDDILCGPFFIVRDNGEGDFASLTNLQIEYYKNRFAQPEQFAEHEPDAEPFMRFIAF